MPASGTMSRRPPAMLQARSRSDRRHPEHVNEDDRICHESDGIVVCELRGSCRRVRESWKGAARGCSPPSRGRQMLRRTLTFAVLSMVSTAALAAEKEPPVTLTKCDKSYGSIALVYGDTQGWTKYGLSSPRELIAAMARESGCFSLHDPASGKPATFLMNVIAGDKEEVDQAIEKAKGVAMEGLVRSGAASGMMRGMFGGFGGKKKVVAAGIRLISPANGQTVASGSGEVKKTTISFGNGGGTIGAVASGATGAAYAGSKDGQMLIEAFVKAFN